jgi:hypothetical protein
MTIEENEVELLVTRYATRLEFDYPSALVEAIRKGCSISWRAKAELLGKAIKDDVDQSEFWREVFKAYTLHKSLDELDSGA